MCWMFGQLFPLVLNAVQRELFLFFLLHFWTVVKKCSHGNKVFLKLISISKLKT